MTNNTTKEAVTSSKEVTAPTTNPIGFDAPVLYHAHPHYFTCRLDNEGYDNLDKHIKATLDIVGLKWISDADLEPGVIAHYINNSNGAFVLTAFNLPECFGSQTGAEWELTAVMQALAYHMRVITNDNQNDIHLRFKYRYEDDIKNFKDCKTVSDVELSLCANCINAVICKMPKENRELITSNINSN